LPQAFVIEDRILGSIPIWALVDHVLVNNAFETRVQPADRTAQFGIARIATLWHAPVFQVRHVVVKHEIQHFGSGTGRLHLPCKPDLSNLDGAIGVIDVHEAGLTADNVFDRVRPTVRHSCENQGRR